jgi:transposase
LTRNTIKQAEKKMTENIKNIRLSNAERQELEAILRKQSAPQCMALRARIILMSADGTPVSDIESQLETTRATICKWKSRFLVDGMEGLLDEPRPGQPPKYGDNTRLKIAFHACHPPKDRKRWTIKDLANYLDVNRGIVQRVLQNNGIKLNNEKTYLEGT